MAATINFDRERVDIVVPTGPAIVRLLHNTYVRCARSRAPIEVETAPIITRARLTVELPVDIVIRKYTY